MINVLRYSIDLIILAAVILMLYGLFTQTKKNRSWAILIGLLALLIGESISFLLVSHNQILGYLMIAITLVAIPVLLIRWKENLFK